MNKNNKLADKSSRDLPSSESEIMIDVQGDTSKKRFVGEFTCKIPRKKEQCLIDKHKAFLNGPQADQLDSTTLRFHHMISYLRYTLTGDMPRWWKESDLGYELYDENVVQELYDKVLDFEVKWLTAIWGEEAINKLKSQGSEEDSDVGEEESKDEDAE